MSLDKGYQHLLISQPPNPAVILTRSREFHTYLSHWDFLMPPSFNRPWVYPVNNPYYDAGNQFFPTVNSHRIAAVISSSLFWCTVLFDAWTYLFLWYHIIFWIYQIFLTTLLIHIYTNNFYRKSFKKDCCIAVIFFSRTQIRSYPSLLGPENLSAPVDYSSNFGWDGVLPG